MDRANPESATVGGKVIVTTINDAKVATNTCLLVRIMLRWVSVMISILRFGIGTITDFRKMANFINS